MLFGIPYLEIDQIASRSSGISKRTCCLGYRISRSIRSRAVRLEFRSAHAVWDTVSRDRSDREAAAIAVFWEEAGPPNGAVRSSICSERSPQSAVHVAWSSRHEDRPGPAGRGRAGVASSTSMRRDPGRAKVRCGEETAV